MQKGTRSATSQTINGLKSSMNDVIRTRAVSLSPTIPLRGDSRLSVTGIFPYYEGETMPLTSRTSGHNEGMNNKKRSCWWKMNKPSGTSLNSATACRLCRGGGRRSGRSHASLGSKQRSIRLSYYGRSVARRRPMVVILQKN